MSDEPKTDPPKIKLRAVLASLPLVIPISAAAGVAGGFNLKPPNATTQFDVFGCVLSSIIAIILVWPVVATIMQSWSPRKPGEYDYRLTWERRVGTLKASA